MNTMILRGPSFSFDTTPLSPVHTFTRVEVVDEIPPWPAAFIDSGFRLALSEDADQNLAYGLEQGREHSRSSRPGR